MLKYEAIFTFDVVFCLFKDTFKVFQTVVNAVRTVGPAVNI